jgi:outer membrane immunogenic protein
VPDFLETALGLSYNNTNGGTSMRRVSLALLASAVMAFGFNQTGLAAELPVQAAPVAPAPAPAPVATWSGFYIGVNGGAAWQSSPSWSFSEPTHSRFADLTVPGNSSAALGAVGGLQIGYLWWVAPIWVFGVEGDFDWASLADHRSGALVDGTTGGAVTGSTLQMSANTQWLSSARARLGVVGWNTLWYVTGGGAWMNTEYTATATGGQLAAGLAGPLSNTSFNTTKAGWVLGGGAEWHVTTNILLRAEYLYYKVNNAAASSATFVPGVAALSPSGPTINYGWSSYNVQVGRIAVSYLF